MNKPKTGGADISDSHQMPVGLSLYLDFVRVLAALAVVLNHAADQQTGGQWMKIPAIGPDAVVVFFVLSGLVIAYTTPSRHASALDYFATRLARLWSVLLPAL